MTDLIETSRDDGILRLVLNDSARRNALSEEMIAALHGELTESAADPAVRVVVIAATGPAFCAGPRFLEACHGESAALPVGRR